MVSRRIVARGLTALAAAFSAAVLAATPAFASWAPLTRTLWLASYPSMPGAAHMTRDIYLAAGNYTWTVSTDNGTTRIGWAEAQRELYLAAGNYRWTCTVFSNTSGLYKNTCSLDAGGGAAYLESRLYEVVKSGDHTLASFLNKH
ncbi:hypothetical protein LG634_21470 [Streptomyces bambusae]|uniref:hypothetical protein n=1 Tax=Streptomyces bambusae TaxID=1550616 RepID=UPI001CFEDA9B|nr:hypothetical protein [Streptomyces bambusae]MCB5167396.1 hypothetical protein [Streptomyces bambusae]